MDKGCSVTSSIIRLKAKELNQKIRENDLEFRASAGWMDKFKKRYGILLKRKSGEQQPIENIKFEFCDDIDNDNDNDNDQGNDNDKIDNNETVQPPHTMTHVEIKTEEDRDFLYEPQYITIEDGDEANMAGKNAISNKSEDCTTVMRCVDEVIQWSIDHHVESLYLTMLKSLRERIHYQSKF